MKIILIGYPGSQKIVPASKYLTSKYLPGFDITYLNYKGPIDGWSQYIGEFLEYLTDEFVIFALDDYLIADLIFIEKYRKAEDEIRRNNDVVCVKLCNSTPEEHEEYPVTTQYCIWRKDYLIWLLKQVGTPWEFEINGSGLLKRGDIYLISMPKKVELYPCLKYFTNSSLSGRWEGVNLSGLKEEDINHMKENELI